MSSFLSKYWLLITAFLIVIVVCGGIVLAMKQSSHKPVEIIISQADSPKYSGEVYIGGTVTNPGVYPFREDDSIESIIQAAGTMSDADLSHIEIRVPKSGETNPPQRISLNYADVWLIAALPGIGQGKAQAIVNYRNQHGPFHRIEDLLNVEGIGKTTLERIRDLVTIEE
jgi:competence protein ComEA